MSSVKGNVGQQVAGKVGDDVSDDQTMEDWADETAESAQLCRALIEAGRAAMPRHDPARLDRVFRRILSRLAEEDGRGERQAIPAPRLDSPSGVTAKLFG